MNAIQSQGKEGSVQFSISGSESCSQSPTPVGEGEIEPSLGPPTPKKVRQVAEQATTDVQQLFQELHNRTELATRDLQYLRAKVDPRDPASSVEVVAQYGNVLCPRHSAVQVRDGKFLHANYITDTACPRIFVASQYPTDLPLFWKFIFEHKHDIIDLSAATCRYAPSNEGETRVVDGLSVRLIEHIRLAAAHSMWVYEVADEEARSSWKTRRLSYTGWPCHGTVSVPVLQALVAQLETVFSGATLVHCSAGLGRTGTLITAYFLKQLILQRQITSDNLEPSLVGLLVQLRKQRGVRFVESKDQLSLLFNFAREMICPVAVLPPPVGSDLDGNRDRESRAAPQQAASGVRIKVTPQTPHDVPEKILAELCGANIQYNRAQRTLCFGYGPSVVRALVEESPTLGNLIGYDYHSTFDGYIRNSVESMETAVSYSRVAALLEKAGRYFQTVVVPKREPFPLPPHFSEQQLLVQCLEHHPGICCGERHIDVSSKEFLCEHFPLLVAHGVKTLFMEHLPSDGLQDEVDGYLASPPESSMPKALSVYLDALSSGFLIREQQCGFKQVVMAAKAAGISKIVCLDTELTYSAGTTKRDGCVHREQRVMAMNFRAIQLIEAYKNAGKYLVFAGGTHITTCNGIPGLADLTGCASLLIQDVRTGREPGIQRDVTVIDDGVRHGPGDQPFHFDVVVTRAPSRHR